MHPGLPHWQCSGLVFRRPSVQWPSVHFLATALSFVSQRLHDTRGAQVVMPYTELGITASELYLSKVSLTPLSVAVLGRLQLGAAHWATPVALLRVGKD